MLMPTQPVITFAANESVCEKSDDKVHHFGAGEIDQEATCQAPGKMYYHCENCGYTKEEIPQKKHVGYVAEDGKAETCTEPGWTAFIRCELCDEVLQTQEEIPAPGHKVVVDKAVEATCSTAGKTEGKYCETCGEILEAQLPTPKARHHAAVKEAIPPTCTKEGKKIYRNKGARNSPFSIIFGKLQGKQYVLYHSEKVENETFSFLVKREDVFLNDIKVIYENDIVLSENERYNFLIWFDDYLKDTERFVLKTVRNKLS